MEKRHFPLSKAKSFKLGSNWHWRVVALTIGDSKCRLLLSLHPTKQTARVMLGREVGQDMLVLARLESHASHSGWHVHADCDMGSKVPGRTRSTDEQRVPGRGKFIKEVDSLITCDDVTARAFKTFMLHKASTPDGGPMVL